MYLRKDLNFLNNNSMKHCIINTKLENNILNSLFDLGFRLEGGFHSNPQMIWNVSKHTNDFGLSP